MNSAWVIARIMTGQGETWVLSQAMTSATASVVQTELMYSWALPKWQTKQSMILQTNLSNFNKLKQNKTYAVYLTPLHKQEKKLNQQI